MATLIFLGAGASKSFGIPTMTEMVSKFENYLKEKYMTEKYLYSRIKENLEKGFDRSKVDIESVFSVVKGIAEQITPKKLGAYPYYYMRMFSSEQKFSDNDVNTAKKLLQLLQDFVQKECRITEDNAEFMQIYNNSYEAFFKNIEGISRTKTSKGYEVSVGWKAYTTNYDLVFENFWAELNPIVDFFTYDETSYGVFNPNKDIRGTWQTFVKLHGSLDWEILEDGLVIKGGSFTRTKKKGKAMLYPIQQKDLYLHPWITLFQEFKTGLTLCGCWYVVGYAFNDEIIFEIFKESLTNRKKMFIINPHANELRNRFPEELRQYIFAIPIRFGGQYFQKDFEDFQSNQRTIEVELKTKSLKFGIDFPRRIEDIQRLKEENVRDAHLTYHDDHTLVEFPTDNSLEKKIMFEATIDRFSELGENAEFSIILFDNVPISVTITNQGRLITTFAITAHTFDQKEGKYVSKRNVPTKAFWLNS